MENKTINIGVVAKVAEALKELKKSMVFVGGAVVSLYTDDAAADEIRPTADIDMTVNLMQFSHWANLQEQLATLGFYPDPFGPSMCRYKYKDIPVDIIPAEDSAIGPTNRWYQVGFKNLQTVQVKNEEIQILAAPCFLATKFEAFNDRGDDYRTSHDIEDIVYVLDNRINIVKEIKEAPEEIKIFLQASLNKIKSAGLLAEVLISHIHPIMIDDRYSLVEEKINEILAL